MVAYMNLEYAVCILGIITCVLILVKSIKNYKLLQNKYNALQVSICLSNCQNGLFKTEDFFHMENSGVNPCKPLNNIEYVDYIGGYSLFMEKNK